MMKNLIKFINPLVLVGLLRKNQCKEKRSIAKQPFFLTMILALKSFSSQRKIKN